MYKTVDIKLAAALIAYGFPISSVDRVDDRRSSFSFKEEDGLLRAADEFYAGKLRLDPQEVLNAFSSLKYKLYSDTI